MPRTTKPKGVSSELADTLRLIPGYDPFATAGNAWFEAEEARLAIEFFAECITHVEGELRGCPFKLEPWQQAVIGNLFGWKRRDTSGRIVRRYRESLIYVPRKNGKTPLVAGVSLFVFFADNEGGQQDYIAAGDRDQAGMLFRQAKGMLDNEPALGNRVKVYGGSAQGGQSRSIVREADGSFLRVLSADADTKHGGNTHLAIIDELHVQPNRDLVDVLQTSMASQNRKQPLFICITTADYDRESICNEKYDYACKVRDRIIEDSSFLPVIYEAGPNDDWRSPETWKKANPNYGVSVSEEYLIRECNRAQETPSYENTFKRFHLNIRTQNDVRWLQLESWDACDGAVDEDLLKGRECVAGIDLSSKLDITAFVLVFPPTEDDPLYRVLPRFWVPADNAHARERKDRVPYETWGRTGLISLTDGNVVDYDFVKAQIFADASNFQIREIAYDPWNATQIALQLQAEGLNVVEFRQGFNSLSEPTKEFERLVIAKKMAHGGNKVLRWMASNASVESDAAGNIKPSKKKSTERIDGIVAMVMALGRSMVATEDYGSDWDGKIQFISK